jgi:polyhydroxybutyrate depolymerase
MVRWLVLFTVSACATSAVPVPDSGLPPIDAGDSDAGIFDAGTFDAGSDDAGTVFINADSGFPPLTTAEEQILTDRPYRLVVPTGYDGGSAVPFVVLLHGYTADGVTQDVYFQMSQLAQARTFILATPDGLRDSTFYRYWNATDFCCGSVGTQKTDDVFYLTAIMNEVRLKYRIDPKRVFFVGHSNGGFMSHRMACERSDRIAAIFSLAGAQAEDISLCQPTEKVSVVEAHGDADAVISYNGWAGNYPSAHETVGEWGLLDGCSQTLVSAGADLDVVRDTQLPGAETMREKITGCATGIGVELWTIRGGSHVPDFTNAWAPAIYDFLMAHPKP